MQDPATGGAARYVRADDVLEAELEDVAVLMHVGSSRYFELNVTGRRIWALLATATDADALVRALGTGPAPLDEQAQGQVRRYLETLCELDLVRRIPG